MDKSHGFTMIELLVVISILAIMASIAAPYMSDFINKNRSRAIASTLMNDMRLAQSEAIKMNRRVNVCAANAAHTDCVNTTDWGVNGWLVCADLAGVCDPALNAIAIRSPVQNNFTVTAGAVTAVIYRPIGTVLNAQTINVAGGNGTVFGAVTVAATGMVTYK